MRAAWPTATLLVLVSPRFQRRLEQHARGVFRSLGPRFGVSQAGEVFRSSERSARELARMLHPRGVTVAYERLPGVGPTWRKPMLDLVDEERTFVVCRCGVDMMFVWPRGRTEVRCFGCGAGFPRPPHLPPDVTLMPLGQNRPDADRTLLERLAPALVLLCCALGATLLALGARFLAAG